MVKKPLPLMARSRLLPVLSMLPWLNCCAISDTDTPLPTAVALTPCWVAANSSENSVRESLKPTVPTLARLFAVTDRSCEAASRPVRAILKDMRCSFEEESCDRVDSENADDAAERHRAVRRVHIERLGRRIQRHAVDRAGDQRIERLGAAAHVGAHRDRVGAGGRGRAVERRAVPAEIREPRGLRRDRERLDECAAGAGDGYRQARGCSRG